MGLIEIFCNFFSKGLLFITEGWTFLYLKNPYYFNSF